MRNKISRLVIYMYHCCLRHSIKNNRVQLMKAGALEPGLLFLSIRFFVYPPFGPPKGSDLPKICMFVTVHNNTCDQL